MTGNFERYNNQHFDNRHQPHRHIAIDRLHDRHRPTTPKVKPRLHDYGQKERQNQITINANSKDRAGPSLPPLIHPSIETLPTQPINIEPEKRSFTIF